MDIVIIADFCCQFEKELNSRFLYLANLLSEDHTVEVITSDFNHEKKDYFKFLPKGFAFTITMLHEGKYKKNVCLSRFKAHFIWGKNVRQYLEKRKKPDIVYCAVPTLQAAYEAAKYCQKNDIKFIVDIQDLWPEAFQMVFNIPIVSNIVFQPFHYLANKIYKAADKVVAVSETYCNRAMKVNDKSSEAVSVFLGTDKTKFDSYKSSYKISESKDEIWLAYVGTLGHSYDLTIVFDALEIVQSKGEKNVHFLVMGDGPLRNQFEEYVKKKKIDVVFTGNIDYSEMVRRLTSCDIAVNPIKHGAAQSIINKVGDYAMSGLPVISTQECSEYKKLLVDYNAGINCENDDVKTLADNIMRLSIDKELRTLLGKNSRRLGEEKFDRQCTYYKIVNDICTI